MAATLSRGAQLILSHGRTDVGRRRSLNEDAIHADVVLPCSNGLTNMRPDSRIHAIVAARMCDLAAACDELIAEANARRGHDNTSVILLRYTT